MLLLSLLLPACFLFSSSEPDEYTEPPVTTEPGLTPELLVEPEPTAQEAQVSLEAVDNARLDFAKNFDILAQMAEKQQKAGYAQTFRQYADWLRTSFVSVECGVPNGDGAIEILHPPAGTLTHFTLYDGNYIATMGAVESYAQMRATSRTCSQSTCCSGRRCSPPP